ncbi:3-methyl-2-oxobutanoate hydroxymethyltransferase [Auritidibacter ignavus]|uniref:3-methyl-2-oxobutanoate hydroxymethyltransferase n=1 Tax=Auritidibacter ignavus TaxID=678932 RepID=UPI00109D7A1B|nr:3-methyl-2-oxobutanoate hydroxymethyltransferase [Auritidibacter ignavus]
MSSSENISYATESPNPKRVRTHHLQQLKDAGHRFAMLTSYDALTARIFDQAGIEVLLVGDSVGNTVLGYDSTIPVTLDQMVLFSQAVARSVGRSLVVADMPFGSYESSVQQAVDSGVRLVKEAQVAAVKLEGGARYAEHVAAMTSAGVAVMGHIGFTPQSEHVLGGFRVQGRGQDATQQMIQDALALQEAGAFTVLMEMVPTEVAAAVDEALQVPTIGIGAGNATTGQVLVWQDAFGLNTGRLPRFVKQYATLGDQLSQAAKTYADEVRSGAFPDEDYSFPR